MSGPLSGDDFFAAVVKALAGGGIEQSGGGPRVQYHDLSDAQRAQIDDYCVRKGKLDDRSGG